MWETLYIASSMRLPIVMAVANRALSGPINIHCDHSDAMGARDSGWIQLFGENVQEAYDDSLMAFRIAEHMDIRLPIMTCLDGFIVTHSLERLETLPDDVVKKFVGEFKWKRSLLDIKNPTTMGPFDWTDYYFEHKYQQAEAMKRVPAVVKSVSEEFARLSGRKYDLIEPYKLDDADYALVAMGSTAGTLKEVVDGLRAEGKKVGSLKLRLFRPFPAEELAKTLEGLKGVAVLDRALSIGAAGPIFPELRSALFEAPKRPRITNYIYGLGGRDIKPEELRTVYDQLMHNQGETVNYLGVRA
jgi:pyruvate ferredoxin oxidoreductase alpha subunit